MDRQGPGCGPLSDLELLVGGTRNILLRFHSGGDAYFAQAHEITGGACQTSACAVSNWV
jgi:hypothetical protein